MSSRGKGVIFINDPRRTWKSAEGGRIWTNSKGGRFHTYSGVDPGADPGYHLDRSEHMTTSQTLLGNVRRDHYLSHNITRGK